MPPGKRASQSTRSVQIGSSSSESAAAAAAAEETGAAAITGQAGRIKDRSAKLVLRRRNGAIEVKPRERMITGRGRRRKKGDDDLQSARYAHMQHRPCPPTISSIKRPLNLSIGQRVALCRENRIESSDPLRASPSEATPERDGGILLCTHSDFSYSSPHGAAFALKASVPFFSRRSDPSLAACCCLLRRHLG